MKLRRRGISAVTSPGRTRFAVLAAVALVVSVAGSAGAAALVTGRQIKDGTVTGRDIHAHTITRADIKDGSLQPQDFLGGSVTGPAGVQGIAGPPGPVGPHGLSGVEYTMTPLTLAPDSSNSWVAPCATPGKVAIAGGETSDNPSVTRLEDSAPTDNHDGWVITAYNANPTTELTVQAWVVCANTR
jgi:hypothetical protein